MYLDRLSGPSSRVKNYFYLEYGTGCLKTSVGNYESMPRDIPGLNYVLTAPEGKVTTTNSKGTTHSLFSSDVLLV